MRKISIMAVATASFFIAPLAIAQAPDAPAPKKEEPAPAPKPSTEPTAEPTAEPAPAPAPDDKPAPKDEPAPDEPKA